MKEGFELGGGGTKWACVEAVEGVLDAGDVLQAPGELEEEEEVVRELAVVHKVGREGEEERDDVMETGLLHQQSSGEACKRRQQMICGGHFVECGPHPHVLGEDGERLIDMGRVCTYLQSEFNAAGNIVQLVEKRGTFAVAHIQELGFKGQIVEARFFVVLVTGINPLRNRDQLLDRVLLLHHSAQKLNAIPNHLETDPN